MFETIFKRRSVRKFRMDELDNIDLVNDYVKNVKQLNDEQATFTVVTSSDIKNNKAPYYVIARSLQKTTSFINVGYCLQEIDLFIQKSGLGSLWLGTGKPNEKTEDYTIMLAFGFTDVPYRSEVKQFKRKDKIIDKCNVTNMDLKELLNNVILPAKLAPSAMNSQPWMIDLSNNCVTIKYCGSGLLKNVLKKKLSKIDLGIITKHVEIGLLNMHKTISAIEIDESKLIIDVFYE